MPMPWAWTSTICHFIDEVDPQELTIVRQQVEKELNAPLTSSMGRLFDAVAVLAGVRNEVTYEAQAAIELETLSRAERSTRNAVSLCHRRYGKWH